MGVAGHHHANTARAEQFVHARERIVAASIPARRVKRMPENGHGEAAFGAAERRVQPRQLPLVHGALDARIDRDQREPIMMQLEERPVLPARRHAVHRAQPRGIGDQPLDPIVGRARQAQIRFDARINRGSRRMRIHQVGGEPIERVEPVVIARHRVNGFLDAFERQVEIRLVILHLAERIHHIRGDYHEPDGVLPRRGQHLVAQRMLRRIAFAWIADHEKREVGPGLEPIRRHRKHSFRFDTGCAAGGHNRIDHRAAPLVDARLGNLLPRRGGPVLAIEVPAESPDRVHRDQDGGDRQPGADHLPHRAGQRVVLEIACHLPPQTLLGPKAERALTPPLVHLGRGVLEHAAPHRAFGRSCEPVPEPRRWIQDHDREHQRCHDIAERGRGGREHAQPGPFRVQAPDVDGEKHHHEDHAPIEIGRRARGRVGPGFAMDEPDDRMRREAQPPIGMAILDSRERIGIARRGRKHGLPTRGRHAEAEQHAKSEWTNRVAQRPHQQREQKIRRPVDEVPQTACRRPATRAANGAHDVDPAINGKHQAHQHHQAAECEGRLHRDQRAGEHRQHAAAVMRTGIP